MQSFSRMAVPPPALSPAGWSYRWVVQPRRRKAWEGRRRTSCRRTTAGLRPWRACSWGSRVRMPFTFHWSRSVMKRKWQTRRWESAPTPWQLIAPVVRPLRLAVGVAVRSVCSLTYCRGTRCGRLQWSCHITFPCAWTRPWTARCCGGGGGLCAIAGLSDVEGEGWTRP
jgi:hypothetical protein